MPSKKLTSLLASLSKMELNRLKKYLISPFFNENKVLIRLFDILLPYLKSGAIQNGNSSPLPDKQTIWEILYPNEPYNDAQLRRLCSELVKLTYGFLACSNLKNDAITEQISILSGLSQLKLEKHFHSLAKQTEQYQNRLNYRNAGFHYNQFSLEQLLHRELEQSGKKVHTFKNLESADYQLDCFYISQKLKHYCDALSYKNFLSLEANIELNVWFQEFLEGSTFLKEVSVKVYYLVMKMLLYPDQEEYFHQAKSLLRENTDKFPHSELNTLYIYLKNYCIDTKINSGHSEYFVELFEIFRVLLEEKILISEGVLDPQDYKNIITVGLHIKKFKWVEHFIQQYTDMLPKDNQENALNYNLAKVYFTQQQYPKVIEQLQEVEYHQLVYALGSKLMLLKTYYELKEFLALDSLIDSFRIYLRRNKMISKDVQQKYLNVLRFVKKLSNTNVNDTAAITKVKKQINECKALADKNWILEKAEELDRSKSRLNTG